jgi:hypothetical protein
MTKLTKIREIDLKPYQTHFLFQSDSLLTSKGIEKLLKELPKIIDTVSKTKTTDVKFLRKVLSEQLPRTSRSHGSLTARESKCDGLPDRMHPKTSSIISWF